MLSRVVRPGASAGRLKRRRRGSRGNRAFRAFAVGLDQAALSVVWAVFWGSAALAFSTTAAKLAGSWIASSYRALRSTTMPDFARPSMKRE